MTSDHHGGVQTRNVFALLDDDEDAPSTSTITKPEEVKKGDKKDTSKRSGAVVHDRDKPTPRVAGGDRRIDGGEKGRGGGGATRGGAGATRGGGGGTRGGARAKGGGGDSGLRERKEFDGHVSRTGKTREPKKDGAGKFNEGSLSDVIAEGTTEDRRSRPRRTREEDAATGESKAEGTEGNSDAPADGGDDATSEKKPAVEVVPEEPKTRTYEQFLLSKKKIDADLAIQTRKAQNDESQFKPVTVHAKSEEKNPYIISSSTEESEEKAKKVKKDKAKHMSFDEFIATGNSANKQGNRGRDGRARGGPRADPRQLAVTDDNFPTLDTEKPVEKGPKEKK